MVWISHLILFRLYVAKQFYIWNQSYRSTSTRRSVTHNDCCVDPNGPTYGFQELFSEEFTGSRDIGLNLYHMHR